MIEPYVRGMNRVFEDDFPGFFDEDQFDFDLVRVPTGRAPSRMQRPPERPPPPRDVTLSRFAHRRIRATDVQKETKCSICLEELTCGDSVCELPCKHIFHDACLGKWLEREATCPVCRKVLGPSPARRREAQAGQAGHPFRFFAPSFFRFWA
jgi:hypothetical protein